MKATIVKNNDFETVGFEVKANGQTIYSWGIAPIPSMYYIKEVDTKDWATEIAGLIEKSSYPSTVLQEYVAMHGWHYREMK